MESLLISVITDVQPGRLLESLIFLGVMFWRLNPHMKKIEDRMQGVEESIKNLTRSMDTNFNEGNKRFERIESNISDIDKRLCDVENKE